MTAKDIIAYMESQQDEKQRRILMRFFKTGKGEYGEGDEFLGMKVPQTREVVKAAAKDFPLEEVPELLMNRWHEVRLCGLLILVAKFEKLATKKLIADKTAIQARDHILIMYLKYADRANNWDLVDLSCYELLGAWLLDRDRVLLYNLARDGKTIWEQRIGMVSTMQFLRHGQLDDTYAIADIFLSKPQPLHDLLQKAVGWLLREAGKRDEKRLKNWLSTRYASMPRTMLRYAIEKFSEEERTDYLKIRTT